MAKVFWKWARLILAAMFAAFGGFLLYLGTSLVVTLSDLVPREGGSGGFGALAGALGAAVVLPGAILAAVFGVGFVVVAGLLVIPCCGSAARRRRAARQSRSEEAAG
ncbi:MAG: hypothetical protein ABIV11_08330 [Gemmatimonadaceae bacterium]